MGRACPANRKVKRGESIRIYFGHGYCFLIPIFYNEHSGNNQGLVLWTWIFTMPEIQYKELKDYLKNLKQDPQNRGFAPVYLIYGETLLYKNALDTLMDALMPQKQRDFNYQAVDGTDSNIEDVVERVNTYSLLGGTKVVAICDSNIFYSKQDEGRLLVQAKKAFDAQDNKNAAKFLLSLLGMLNLSLNDISGINRKKMLKLEGDKSEDTKWLDEIIKFCMENNLSILSGEHHADLLQHAIEKGFPKGNHLVITTDMVDKRRKLFKIIKKNGIIIDCSVPKGDRRADKIAQEVALTERMDVLLDRHGKTMDKDAYLAMYELTGFDMETFCDNLEKLISFVGDRKKITVKDVTFVLKRTKKDPIYELTNAIADRNLEASIFYLNSLMTDNFHPLQILASITNQIRKLLMIKDFVESSHGSFCYPEIQYGLFKDKVTTAIQSYNREFLDQMEQWDEMLSIDMDGEDKRTRKKREKKKSRPATDLEIANNPYPAYKMMLMSKKYTKNELVDAIEHLAQADFRLKYTKQKPKMILEETILWICNTSLERKQNDDKY